MNVTKRDNTRQELDLAKIRRAVEWACEGVENVDPMRIELGAKIQFYDGIKTSEIQNAMVLSAQRLISEDTPNYTFPAARLMLMNIYQEVGATSDNYLHLRDVLVRANDNERIDPELLTFDLDVLNSAIDKERDKSFELLGLITMYDRYLLRTKAKQGDKGDIIELPQHFLMRVAMGLCLNYPAAQRTEKAIEFYNQYSKLEFLSSTPTLFNSGTPFSQMSSCYGNTVEDDLVNKGGIFDKITECARLSKFAGGIGTDWHKVRAADSPIHSTNGLSSGIVPFLKVFNDTSVAVNQCFSPETLVYTDKGIKPIADIKPRSDLVLTERGVYREVLEKLDYDQTDEMVAITLKHSLEPVRVTTQHPFQAIQGVPKEQSISRTMKWLQKGSVESKWVDAGKLKDGDYVALTIPQEVVASPSFDEDAARMYGIMLGDGHFSKRNGKITEGGVSFNRDSDAHREFVCKYLERLGVHYWVVEQPNTKLVQVRWTYSGESHVDRCSNTGRILSKESKSCLPFGYDDLYSESKTKRIHPCFMHLPLSQAKQLVRGLIETDGCISRGKEITFHNTSQELIEGLRYQMLRCKVPTAGNIRNRVYKHQIVRENGVIDEVNSRGICYDLRIPAVDWLAGFFHIPSVSKFNWLEFGGCVYTRVKSVERLDEVDASPVVYDLRVENIHSYTTTNGLVHNGGKRKGAFSAYIEPHHADAPDFMTLKRNAGDERRRTHDIFPAWWLNDLLFERYEQDGMWSYFDPKEVPELHELHGEAFKKAYEEAEAKGLARKQVKARELMREMVLSLMDTGAPWFTFKDEHNRRNPQQHIGVIHNTNLCTEISLNNTADETFVCNLGSINLSKFVVNGKIDMTKLANAVRTGIEMLDNVIDLNYYPSEESRRSNMRHRPIGLGVMGYAEALNMCGIDYESQEHLEWAHAVFECISFNAILMSCELAQKYGAYESFSGSLWSKGILAPHTAKDSAKALVERQISEEDWTWLSELVMKHGLRNCNLLAIAPTATIANIAGTTPCTELPIMPTYLKANLSGTFKFVDPSMRHNPSMCKYAYDIDQEWAIKSAAVRQIFVDQAQSLNLFRRKELKGRDVLEWYILAWKLGLKSTYYLKNQKRNADAKKAGEK